MAARFTQDQSIQVAQIASTEAVRENVIAAAQTPTAANLVAAAIALIDATLAVQA